MNKPKTEYLTAKEILDKYGDFLTENEKDTLNQFIAMKTLANEFSKLLTEYLGAETVAKINLANESYPPETCASHDFCDANMVMYEAFQNILGEETDVHSDESIDQWNQAWSLAKNNKFRYENL